MTHEIMRHWESLFPGRVFRLTLEQLIADQERVTKQLLSFCGLSWDPAVVRFYETKRLVTTASQSQVPFNNLTEHLIFGPALLSSNPLHFKYTQQSKVYTPVWLEQPVYAADWRLCAASLDRIQNCAFVMTSF